jgi:hypothetical protein
VRSAPISASMHPERLSVLRSAGASPDMTATVTLTGLVRPDVAKGDHLHRAHGDGTGQLRSTQPPGWHPLGLPWRWPTRSPPESECGARSSNAC